MNFGTTSCANYVTIDLFIWIFLTMMDCSLVYSVPQTETYVNRDWDRTDDLLHPNVIFVKESNGNWFLQATKFIKRGEVQTKNAS